MVRFGGGLLKRCWLGGMAWIHGMVFFDWLVLGRIFWIIWGGGVSAGAGASVGVIWQGGAA